MRRSWRSPTVRVASGRRSARSGRKSASNDAGSTRLQTCWPSGRRANTRKPSVRCRTSGWPKPKSTPRPHSTPLSEATRSSTTRPPNACARITKRCWRSKTSPCRHWKHLRTTNPIESRFATVRHRTNRTRGWLSNKTALPWCSSWSRARRGRGTASMVTPSCQNLSCG
jgi:hypothetical protein